MNDPNGIFVGENTQEPLVGFDLIDPYICQCAGNGEPIDDIGSFNPSVVSGSNAIIDGVLSSIPPVPEEVNFIAVATKTNSSHFAVFPLPIDGV